VVTATITAATLSADSESGHLDGLDPLGSPLPALIPPYGRLAVTRLHMKGKSLHRAQASPLGPELRWYSPDVSCFKVTALFRAPQYLTGYRTLCLPARLCTLLLTAINICFTNLCGCLSEYRNPTSHTTILSGKELRTVEVSSVYLFYLIF
jgi:hypothetical protein